MKHWPLLLLTALAFTAHAQNDYNPFAGIGKKAKIVTASNGEFEEFNYDTIQRIGSVLINTKTRKIVKLLGANKTFAKASDNSAQSRWYRPDRLAEKYYDWSPYNYVENNPIKNSDPNGDSLTVVTGDPNDTKSQPAFVDAVNQALGGFYTVKQYANEDGTTGMTLEQNKDATGDMTDKQKAFFNAVQGAFNGAGQVTVVLDNASKDYVLGDNGNGKTQSIDMADQKALNNGSLGLVSTAGGIGHELNEAYQTQIQGVAPETAHENAIKAENKIDGSVRNPHPDKAQNTYSPVTGSGVRNEEYTKNGHTYIVSYTIVNNNITDIQVTPK